jgi:hypothetical protein
MLHGCERALRPARWFEQQWADEQPQTWPEGAIWSALGKEYHQGQFAKFNHVEFAALHVHNDFSHRKLKRVDK